jgi:internalin A
MPSHPDGLAIAQQRIVEEKENRTGFLDLGRLGLTELPEEIFELTHLRGLSLGSYWRDNQGDWHEADPDLAPNQIAPLLGNLHRFPGLKWLSLRGSDVGDLGPVAGLSSLQSLDCSDTPVSDLGPVAGLSSLQSLDCSSTPVSDLGPVAGLSSLQSLHCVMTQVSDLGPVAGLSSLQSLHCSYTQVSDLGPVAGLSSLQSLDCSDTQVSDLGPVAGLSSLQSLDCSDTPVSDLGPVAGLSSLQSLNCRSTQVSDLGPVAGLSSLQSLNCAGTPVSDLHSLCQLVVLRELRCDATHVSDLPDGLIWLDSLQRLCLHDTPIADIPTEVRSESPGDDCLDRIRAHLRDLEAGSERLPDAKALVLGNGRIGKTQICRRLRGELFDANVLSTHGILVTSVPLAMPAPEQDGALADTRGEGAAPAAAGLARLHLWDFGGQDLYHGTHALFLRTRSLFLLVWTPQSEDTRVYQHGGITFRNHPLAYWLEYVRHLSGVDSPVLVVQNMCDRPEEESLHPPVDDEALGAFPFRKVLHYSALNNRGRGALDDALRQAVGWLWRRHGQARIGTGRLAVKRKLEALRDQDAAVPAEQRKYRTLTREFFEQLCHETGGVSQPDLLLDYLHHAGVVFYRPGLFDDRIVLDQSWALQAVYAVFDREKCYRQLRWQNGRFTRPLLEALVWNDYQPEEQELFLSLMQSCGVCFVHRPGDRQKAVDTEYIAPDLLPGREEVAVKVGALWDETAPAEEFAVRLPFLHPGIMRGIISRLGQAAGIDAVYWNNGVCLYEKTTRSHALIEQARTDSATTWSGRIVVRTQGGQAVELLGQLQGWLREVLERSGCRNWEILAASSVSQRPAQAAVAEHRDLSRRAPTPEADSRAAEHPWILQFGAPPSRSVTYCVSYAWNEESNTIVDGLCTAAETRCRTILRDKTGMGLGESITRFMQKLGAGDCVFVILSEKYLKSPFCMYELLEVWRNCQMSDDSFRQRIRVYRLPDAAISTPADRILHAVYWDEQFQRLDAVVRRSPHLVGRGDFDGYKRMLDFARHVGDMLFLIGDTLRPRDFDELVRHGFDDESGEGVSRREA